MALQTRTVTPTKVLTGTGIMYVGLYGTATEPSAGDVNTTPQLTAGWTEVGATKDGLTTNITQEFYQSKVDAIPDPLNSHLVSREVRVTTNMAEATLANLAIALNDSTATTGSGYSKLSLPTGGSGYSPTYRSLIVDGYGPGTNKKRRFLARRVLSVEPIESSQKDDDDAVWSVTFLAHYVDASTPPCDWIDET